MPSIYIPSSLRRLVTSRAHGCCEYCLLASEDAEFPHEIDHQVPIIHGGKLESDNLVLACLKCNRYKGTNLAINNYSTTQSPGVLSGRNLKNTGSRRFPVLALEEY